MIDKHDYRKSLESMPEAKRRALTEGTWKPPKPIGLRSHGCVERKWVPTKSRFTSLEAKDESWARYFGLGRIVTIPMELYDVRDWDKKLVGYSEMDPSKCWRDRMLVSVLEERVVGRCFQETLVSQSTPARRGSVKTIEVATRLHTIGMEYFVSWSVHIEDAEALARAGWLKCIGKDHFEEFCYKLQRRAY